MFRLVYLPHYISLILGHVKHGIHLQFVWIRLVFIIHDSFDRLLMGIIRQLCIKSMVAK